jgi:hypothetical protein
VSNEHPKARPPDHTDAAKDVARGLSEAASHLASLKGEAMSWLRDPNYAHPRLRLENAHAAAEAAAVEARRRVRINEEDARRR